MKKKNLNIYTPRRMMRELEKIGEKYSKKKIFAGYLIACITAILSGFVFNLKIPYIIVIGIFCLYVAPFVMMNGRKRIYEQKRFHNINSYMSQMAQSFSKSENILACLQESIKTFPNGEINQVLREAVKHIENSSDMKEGEKEALLIIEEKYPCERLRVLHEFLLKSERGGEFKFGLSLLEKIRIQWAKVVLKCQEDLKGACVVTIVEYLILALVCAYVVNRIPGDIAIVNSEPVQVINCFLVLGFLLIVKKMDKRRSGSLLQATEELSKEECDKMFDYVRNFDKKKSMLKMAPIAAIIEILFIILTCLKPSVWLISIGTIFVLGILNFHSLAFQITYKQLREEIEKAYPKWLFDVFLLMQDNNVQVSIFKSIEKAPPVLQSELETFKSRLMQNPNSAEIFLSFLAEFNVNGLDDSMRILYSISEDTGLNKENIEMAIENNMELLGESECKKIQSKQNLNAAFYFVPMIPCIIAMIGYGIALVVTIFAKTMQMI